MSSVSEYTFFRIYRSLHLYFNGGFNVFKYGYNHKGVSQAVFDAARNKYRFRYFSNHFATENEVIYFCVANFFYGKTTWLYDDWGNCSGNYKRFTSYFDAFTYKFKQELSRLASLKKDDNISLHYLINRQKDNEPAPLLTLYLNGKYSAEFICTLASMYDFLGVWKEDNVVDPFITREVVKLQKYEPFVKIRRKEIASK